MPTNKKTVSVRLDDADAMRLAHEAKNQGISSGELLRRAWLNSLPGAVAAEPVSAAERGRNIAAPALEGVIRSPEQAKQQAQRAAQTLRRPARPLSKGQQSGREKK